MAIIRFEALKTTLDRKPVVVNEPAERRSELYGLNVFNTSSLNHFMSKEAFNAVMDAINHGKKIDRKIADQVASAMKSWAISKACNSLHHWFQPLTRAVLRKNMMLFSNPMEMVQL